MATPPMTMDQLKGYMEQQGMARTKELKNMDLLLTLDDLPKMTMGLPDIPMTTPGQVGNIPSPGRLVSQRRFSEKISAILPWLGCIDTRNLVIAGSLPMHLATGQSWGFKDADIFLCGIETREHGLEVVERLMMAFGDFAGERSDIIRERSCITFKPSSGLRVQVVCFLNHNVAEIINGFDIPSCAVAYDCFADKTFLTRGAYYSLSRRIIIFDMGCYRRNYLERLVKYFGKGFRLAFPQLIRGVNKFRIGLMEVKLQPGEARLLGHPEEDEFFYLSSDNVEISNIVKLLRGGTPSGKRARNGDYSELLYSDVKIDRMDVRHTRRDAIEHIESGTASINYLLEFMPSEIIAKNLLREDWVRGLREEIDEIFSKIEDVETVSVPFVFSVPPDYPGSRPPKEKLPGDTAKELYGKYFDNNPDLEMPGSRDYHRTNNILDAL